ncbi:MAG: hypothetical protein ABIT09_07065 [Croceibacterium sp.]
MSIPEKAAKYGVSRKLIRKMIKGGDFRHQPKGDLAAFIRVRLSSDQQLSVQHLLALIHDRRLFRELGAYGGKARDQVGELGYVGAGAATSDVTDHLRGAAEGHPESVRIVMQWLRAVLPRGPVRHHWVAARLLISRWPNLRHTDFYCVVKALEIVRDHPGFSGWWSKKPVGTQNPVFYHQPILLFDL